MSLAAPPASGSCWWSSPPLQAVAWQVSGSAATLAAAIWVSSQLGLAAQGDFGLAKSWFDAAAAVAALGLPQGLLHLQYRLGVPAGALRGWLRRWLALLAAVAWAATGVSWLGGHRLAAAVAAALPFGVAHLLARSLLLPRSVRLYGAATALPALLVLAGVGAFVARDWRSGFDVLLLTTTVFSAAVSLTLAWPRRLAAATWSRGELWRTSGQSWLQQALAAAMIAALLSLVAVRGNDAVALGEAALALQVYQVFVGLVGYASPLLFDHLARQLKPALVLPRAAGAGIAAVLLPLAGAALLLALPPSGLSRWLLPLLLMLSAGLVAVAARVKATVLLARGCYAELSVQAVARLVLVLVVAWPALGRLPAAAAVAAALLVTEAATWWRCQRCLRAGA